MIELERQDPFFVMRMDNGENRFTLDFFERFHALLDEVQAAADGPAVLLLTGQGKFWSNGIDLDWLGAAPVDEQAAFLPALDRLFGRLVSFDVPTVGVLNGHTFAGGGLLALCLDMRIMREDRGWFCLPEVDIGVPFDGPMTSLLRTKLRPEVLRDAVLTGRRYTGPEALEAGIVEAVAPEADLLDAARALAEPLAQKKRGIYGKLKQLLYGELAAELGHRAG